MTRHAGGVEPLKALLGVDQQRRRAAGQDRVGVVVERDHGRCGPAPAGLGDEVLEQVAMAEVEPVEDADHDEDRARLPRQRVDAVDHPHRRRQLLAAATGGGDTNTLSGASRPPDEVAMATRAPSGPRSR